MVTIHGIAILAAIIMLCCYTPVMKYLRVQQVEVITNQGKKGRDNTKGKKNYHYTGKKKVTETITAVSTEQDAKIGFSILMVVMVFAFLIRVVSAVVYKGNEADMNCFIAWADMVYNDGLKQFYLSDAFHDYPPGYMYILYVIGATRATFGIAWDSGLSILLTKLPAILSDLGTGYLIYQIARKHFKETGAAFLSALYLICPAVILDSSIWGQTDAVFTFFVVLMCYLVTEKKLIPAYFVFAIAILIKPQSLIFTPVLICAIIDQVFLEDFNWKKFGVNLSLGIVAILMIGILMLPFGFKEALVQYTDTLGSYEYATVNAYNFWAMLGLNWQSQDGVMMGFTYQQWGTLAIVLIVIASIVLSIRCKQTKSKYYFIGAFIVTLVFTFSVRMHERYIFPAMILFLLAFAERRRKELYYSFVAVSTIAFYNIAHVLFVYDVNNFNPKAIVPILTGLAMVAFSGYMICIAVKFYGTYIPEKVESKAVASASTVTGQVSGQGKAGKRIKIRSSEVLYKMEKKDYIALGIITLVYAVIAFARLGNMSAPETKYSLCVDGPVVLDFGQDVNVASVWDFLGYQNNPKYHIEYTSDVNGAWNILCGEGSEWDAGSVFCWNQKEVNVTARYFRISASPNTYEDSLHELVFQDDQGNAVVPLNASQYQNLFDEQDLFEGRASNMNGTYFDEIYHARTAYEMIQDQYCYENTHPPLGKAFIALGILIFGMNPFGWRFMGTLFGVLMVPIIYNFAKKLFKETWICVVTTLLFTFDFMHFVQTRIATIDVFVTLFIMLSYYFMYCYTKLSFYDTKLTKTFIPLGLCGVIMGISWASKWAGIYSAVGLCIIFFAQMLQRFREYIYACKYPKEKSGEIEHTYIINNFHDLFLKTIGFCMIFFVAVPAVIYTLSYLPFNDGSDRGLIESMIQNQKTMFNYHSGLDAEHGFSSYWYQWPIMYRPMWYYSGVISDTLREGISAFGNPLVWWAGIPAAIFMLYIWWKEKDKKAGFMVIGYLSQYAPWFLVTRVVFIYHYFPSVPFVTLMLAYSLYRLVQWKPKWKKAVYVYVGLAIALFVLFYPVLSGLAISPDFAKKWLIWFDSWVLLKTW